MRLSALLLSFLAFAAGGLICLVAANFAVAMIEDSSEINLRQALDSETHTWAEVQADGLQVILSGTAPDEATRFNALSTAGGVVDAARIIDAMQVAPSANLAAPRFSVEILRNEVGISVIGLIPADTDRDALIERLGSISGHGKLTDLLETANYPVPKGWDKALGFAITTLEQLPRSKISVDAGKVSITAITGSVSEKQALEKRLNRSAPPELRLALDVSAPRPVITPFTLRFLIDETGAHFDACSADTDASRKRIERAAQAAGFSGNAGCVVGMGVPSANWARAAELGIRALAELGQGSVTMSDADITLVASRDISAEHFDRVVGELDTALPAVFALHAILPDPEDPASSGPPEFVATLSPEGQVQLRGRVSDETLRQMADSYAKARFGSNSVYTATRVVNDLPDGWAVRVLGGLEALSLLNNGILNVTPDNVTLKGITERPDGRARAAQLLSERLGETETYDLEITYRPAPEPVDRPPTPEECETELAKAQETGKITFEPGLTTIEDSATETMDRIAEILNRCGEIRLEIQGHTDSQGRESMNLQLSQARAQSVLNELRARRVLTATYAAVGYGESQPIADNETDEDREDNRRIEFHVILPEQTQETETMLETVASETADEDPASQTEAGAEPGPEQDQQDQEEQAEPEDPENEQN